MPKTDLDNYDTTMKKICIALMVCGVITWSLLTYYGIRSVANINNAGGVDENLLSYALVPALGLMVSFIFPSLLVWKNQIASALIVSLACLVLGVLGLAAHGAGSVGS